VLWTANIVCVWLSDWLSACTPPVSVCLIGWVSPQSKLCMRVNSAIKTVIRISWIILFLLQSVVLLPRDAMLARYMPSLCLRLSVTSRYCVKTTKHRITQATLHDSPRSLVFWCQRSPRNSTGVNSTGISVILGGGKRGSRTPTFWSMYTTSVAHVHKIRWLYYRWICHAACYIKTLINASELRALWTSVWAGPVGRLSSLSDFNVVGCLSQWRHRVT